MLTPELAQRSHAGPGVAGRCGVVYGTVHRWLTGRWRAPLQWHTADALAGKAGFADGSDVEKALDRCGLTG